MCFGFGKQYPEQHGTARGDDDGLFVADASLDRVETAPGI